MAMTADSAVTRGRKRRGALAALAFALLVLIGSTALAGCSSSSSSSAGSAGESANPYSALGTAAQSNPNLDPGSSEGGVPAPDFRLVNQFGQAMSLSQFRGKVILLGFEDSECTTICPLTTQSMVLAKQLLGKAGTSVQLLGIDANPDATAVSNVLAYSQAHGMVNQWDFLTGSPAQLKQVWTAYHVAVQIESGQIDHTPALFVIDQQGRLQKVYLTQMAYSSIGQSAQVVAEEVSSLLPSHPKLASLQSLAAIPGQGPTAHVTLPGFGGGTVTLGPGKARLVVFFASWLSETSDLKAGMTGLNAYATASSRGLPPLTAVDEAVTEPSDGTLATAMHGLGKLDYPVGLDETGRLADGYGVQDQPWFVLINAAGKVVWTHGGWQTAAELEAAAHAHLP
jgi:cytochrome oxidase Cu insertion factor (SCO1/SenC/PrrC family)